MNTNFRSLVEHLEPKLATLRTGNPSKPLEVPRSPRRAGVYLFSEGDYPLYVGRTRNLGARIRNHATGPTSNTATFAFLLARKATGRIKATYHPTGSREALLGDPAFRREFDKAKQRIQRMDVRFVEETDPTRQALLEIYCAVALKTEFNSFDTH